MTTTIGDDAVTISEALKRLGNQAPSKPAFYNAVNSGKITKAPMSADGKIRVYMASVRQYIKEGGFKKRGKAGRKAAASDAKVHAEAEAETSAKAELSDESLPIPSAENNNSYTGKRKPPESEPPAVSPVPVKQYKNHGQDSQSRSETKPKPSTWKQRKPVPEKKHATHKTKVKSNGVPDAKGSRRNPPLRVVKNTLRHLDFEQTKAIRDWADNRLLTVLRPAAPVLANPDEETKSPV
jgi:hypothetical protein